MVSLNGQLFGATQDSGPNGLGTIYSVDPSSGVESLLYSLDDYAPTSPMIAVNGLLYGSNNGGANGAGSIFSFDPATHKLTVLYTFLANNDGVGPSGLISSGGMLYGTTFAGSGTNNMHQALFHGTVFSVNPATGVETILYVFQGGNDGDIPQAGLILVGDTLYGTTLVGGAANLGTVFALNLSTGTETVLHAFEGGKDGSSPTASLVDVNGTLYGTTLSGGVTPCLDGCGVLYSVNETTGAEKVLYAFKDSKDGADPYANLINVGGTLYGTARVGGSTTKLCQKSGGCGTV